MFKKIRFLFVCVSLLIVGLGVAHASGLLVSPQRLVFEQRDRVKDLRVVNRSDKPQKYRVLIVDKEMTPDGRIELADKPAEGEVFASKFLRYGPRQIELQPRESQTIRVLSRLPANAPDGEYRSHIVVQEVPDVNDNASKSSNGRIGLSINAIFGMSIPVFLRHGDLQADVSLSDAKMIRRDGVDYVQFKINRSGNKSVFGTARVLMGSKEITLLKGIAVYLSTPYRVVEIEIPERYQKSIYGQTLRITYSAIGQFEDTPDAETQFKVD